MSARARTDLAIGLVLAVLGAAGVAWQAGVSSAEAGELMHRTFICPLGGHAPAEQRAAADGGPLR